MNKDISKQNSNQTIVIEENFKKKIRPLYEQPESYKKKEKTNLLVDSVFGIEYFQAETFRAIYDTLTRAVQYLRSFA